MYPFPMAVTYEVTIATISYEAADGWYTVWPSFKIHPLLMIVSFQPIHAHQTCPPIFTKGKNRNYINNVKRLLFI